MRRGIYLPVYAWAHPDDLIQCLDLNKEDLTVKIFAWFKFLICLWTHGTGLPYLLFWVGLEKIKFCSAEGYLFDLKWLVSNLNYFRIFLESTQITALTVESMHVLS